MRVSTRSVDSTSTKPNDAAQTPRTAQTAQTEVLEEQQQKKPAATAEYGATHFVGASAAVDAVKVPAVKGPREVVDDFYAAFGRKDGAAMTAAYAPNAHFSDKVFPSLDGPKAGAMWRMLTNSPELKVEHKILKVEGDTVTAQWIARYPAPGTGRPVENHVTATLEVRDGKIVDHKDDFDMEKWTHMAFGGIAKLPFMSGVLAGVTRHLAGRQLEKFVEGGG